MQQSLIYHGGGMNHGGFGFPSASGSTAIISSKISVSHLDFQGAFLTKTNVLFSLPAGSIILFARLKPSVIWLGGAITNYYLSIGITGALQDIMNEYDANIAVSDQEYAESFSPQSFDYNNAFNIQVTARSIGANLDQSVSGVADVELFYLKKV